jgi:uncharacterized protein YlxP (DUF503 family)
MLGKMRLGVLKVRLLMRESRSLKDKRSVIKSIKDKLKNKFNISVAEVGGLDNKQIAELGIALVSNDSRFTQSVLSKVLMFIRSNPFAEVTDSEIEIL